MASGFFIHSTIEPSGTEHSTVGYILSRTEQHLVTTCRSMLCIYQMKKRTITTKHSTLSNKDNTPVRLILVKKYTLDGIITGISAIPSVAFSQDEIFTVTASKEDTYMDIEISDARRMNHSLDYLMISIEFSRVSIITWNTEQSEFCTISLHHFERPEYYVLDDEHSGRSSLSSTLLYRGIRIDPLFRCAALPISNNHLALMFLSKKHPITLQYRNDSHVATYTKDIDPSIRNVIDICFLHGFHEPTIAILFQPEQTWPGRLPYTRDTCTLLWVSINSDTKACIVLGRKEHLPHDSFHIHTIPQPLGGLFVLSQNILIHLDQSGAYYYLAINSFYPYITNEKSTNTHSSSLNITLEGSRLVQISHFMFLFILKNGSIYTVSITKQGRAIQQIKMDQIGSTEPPSCLIQIDQNRLFLGTNIGSASLLIRHKFVQDEDDLYSSMTLESTDYLKSSMLQTESWIEQVGSNDNYCIGYQFNNIQNLQLMGTHGQGSTGGICILQESIHPVIITSFPMSNSDSIWTIPFHKKKQLENFLILSSSMSTMILVTQGKRDDIIELEISDFYLEGRTLAVNLITDHSSASGSVIIQVYHTGIRCILAETASKMQQIDFDDPIKDAIIHGLFVLVMMQDCSKLYRWSKSKQSLIELIQISEMFTDSIQASAMFSISSSNPHVDDLGIASYSKGSFQVHVVSGSTLKIDEIFKCNDMHDLPDMLTNNDTGKTPNRYHNDIQELLMISHNGIFYLLCRSIFGDVYIYKLIKNDGIFSIKCFDKLDHSVILRMPTTMVTSSVWIDRPIKSMFYFSNVQGYSGVFISGYRPHWLLFPIATDDVRASTFYDPVMLPMIVDGSIRCFSSFNHETMCQNGFVYVNNDGQLRLSTIKYDGMVLHSAGNGKGILMKKISYKKSCKFVAFHHESRTWSIITSRSTDFTLPPEDVPPGAEYHPTSFETFTTDMLKIQGTVLPKRDSYTIELLSGKTYESIDQYMLLDHECCLCMTTVTLNVKQTKEGKQLYLAVGTGYLRGEDRATRGRALLFDIIDVVPDPKNPERKHKLKLVAGQELKGPVTSISEVLGYLATSIGAKVILHTFSDGESLTAVAFQDVAIYAKDIIAFKNFFLVGDAYRSISFYAFQEEPARMFSLGKDFVTLDVQAIELFTQNGYVYFLVSDRQGNIHVYGYDPYHPASMSGNKLLHVGDYYHGGIIGKFLRYKPLSRSDDDVICNTYSTFDGELGRVIPLRDKQYKRLEMLYKKMLHMLYSLGGLNHMEHRTAKCYQRLHMRPSRGIIDGTYMMSKFNCLSRSKQSILTKSMGTTVERIYDDFISLMNYTDLL